MVKKNKGYKLKNALQDGGTSLAEADHYPHVAQYEKYAICSTVMKANFKGSGLLPY